MSVPSSIVSVDSWSFREPVPGAVKAVRLPVGVGLFWRRVQLHLLRALLSLLVLLGMASMSLLGHIEELRRRLIVSLAALGIAFVGCFTVSRSIFQFLMTPLRQSLPQDAALVATTVPEIFLLHMKMSFLAAVFLAMPVILYQVWRFVAPGLYTRERRFAPPFVLTGTLFFALGAAFAHYVVFPYAARFLVTFGGEDIGIMLTVSSVFAFYSRFVLGMGLVFQIPTAAVLLGRLGIVTPGLLWRKANYSTILIFLVAALITPTGDPVNLCLVALPMLALYFLSIALVGLTSRGAERVRGEDPARP